MKELKRQIILVSEEITIEILAGRLKEANNLTLLLNDLISKALKIKRLYNEHRDNY